MKIPFTRITLMLWTIPLTAMTAPLHNISMIEFKLIRNQIAYGIHVPIPHTGQSNQYFISPFHFSFRKGESQDPYIDLFVKTEETQDPIELISCPLLPGTTSIKSFTYKNSPYTAYVCTIAKSHSNI